MMRRSTWITLAIFAVLVGFTWILQRSQSNKSDNTATITPTVHLKNLYNLDSDQVEEINISDSSGNQIGFYRDSENKQWMITDAPVEQADSLQIESISTRLFDLQAQETLTQTPPLGSIGLVTPSYTITITIYDGSQLITYIGSETAIGSGYYVMVDMGQVEIVDNGAMDDILGLLSNPPLLPTPTPEEVPTENVSTSEPGTQGTDTP